MLGGKKMNKQTQNDLNYKKCISSLKTKINNEKNKLNDAIKIQIQ
jgi:hypothetical protein